MRIISGKFRGRKLLESTHLKALRPTTDANREALFNILNSAKFLKEINFELENSTIIDICCGTGAIALEAISRGAKSAILVDNSKTHLDLAKKNAEMLNVADSCRFLLSDVKKNLNIKIDDSQCLVFIDPPYEEDFEKILDNLISQKIFPKNSLFVIETVADKCDQFSLKAGNIENKNFKLLDLRKYGKTVFLFVMQNQL